MDKLRRIAGYLAVLALVLNTVLLLVAISAPYIDPYYFWPPALLGLFFKLFLGIHIVFFFNFLFFRQWRSFIASAIILLACIPSILKTFAMNGSNKENVKNVSGLTIMTYNVANFGWYASKADVNAELENIRFVNPDIICFQEYYKNPKSHASTLARLVDSFGYRYYFENVSAIIPKNEKIGLAIFSRIPFMNVTPITFGNTSNGAFYTDFAISSDTFRLINVHFESIGLRQREYKLPTEEVDFKGPRWRLYRISLFKFRKAFRKRSMQVKEVEKEIARSPYRVILCGDFNDTPVSYIYRTLTKNLKDSWLETGNGMGSTYAGRIPFQRIDYVLTDTAVSIHNTEVIKRKGSDHYPLVCRFSLESPNANKQ